MFAKREVSKALQKELLVYYNTLLAKGVDIGYNDTLDYFDEALAISLKNNIAEFSAFKETAFKKELEAALVSGGKIVPWNDFKKVALRVSGLYNVNWLETEYNHTIATANMAGKWQDFQNNKDLYPNLQYSAIHDARTRKSHKAWDGLIAPIDHAIWKEIYPPSDHGCRCGVTQTDKAVSKNLPAGNLSTKFKNNAAISGKIYKDIVYQKRLTKAEVKAARKAAKDLRK